MDNYFQTYGYLGGPGFRSDDQTTDSYQSPDVFLNLEENKPQAKIEEQDEFIKNEWVTQENKEDEKVEFQNNPFENKEQSKFQQQQQQQQFNNMKPMPMNQKRSMKIKKEKAKIMASKKREQQRLAQQAMQQAQQQQQQSQTQTQTQSQVQSQQQQQQQAQQVESTQQQFQSGSQSPILKQEQDSDLTNETMLLEDKKQTQSMEGKPDKSMLQKIRNRISAQNSRDRKKAYIQDLENKSKEFQVRNVELSQQINQLMAENEQQKKENISLKRELLAIKKKYGECTDEYFQEPCINKRMGGSVGFNNYGTFGFALLSIVSLIMLTNMNAKSNTPSTILPKIGQETRTDLSRQLDLEQIETTTFEKLDKQSPEYNQLKDIVDCGALQSIQEENNMLQNNNNTPLKLDIQLKEEISIKQEEGMDSAMEFVKPSMKMEENNSIVKASESEKISNLRPCINCDKDVSSTGLSKISPRQNVSTIFCPQPYRYYPNQEMNSQEQQVYKNQEWLQLFLPKQELNAFSQEVDNIFVKRNGSDQEQQKKIVEVWAKVHSVREIEHKEMKRV